MEIKFGLLQNKNTDYIKPCKVIRYIPDKYLQLIYDYT